MNWQCFKLGYSAAMYQDGCKVLRFGPSQDFHIGNVRRYFRGLSVRNGRGVLDKEAHNGFNTKFFALTYTDFSDELYWGCIFLSVQTFYYTCGHFLLERNFYYAFGFLMTRADTDITCCYVTRLC